MYHKAELSSSPEVITGETMEMCFTVMARKTRYSSNTDQLSRQNTHVCHIMKLIGSTASVETARLVRNNEH